eukprot:GHVR01178837.1.p1 GENE.GHVR01178837.1~~GHVR01178837.1.p1  ORF type:complete len:147 (-),score=68.75 GHVR01178837.1:424-864(-)
MCVCNTSHTHKDLSDVIENTYTNTYTHTHTNTYVNKHTHTRTYTDEDDIIYPFNKREIPIIVMGATSIPLYDAINVLPHGKLISLRISPPLHSTPKFTKITSGVTVSCALQLTSEQQLHKFGTSELIGHTHTHTHTDRHTVWWGVH